LLPREMYDRVYQSGPDVAVAGSIQPVGTAQAGHRTMAACERL
jgi:hypothetical protein